MFYCSPDEHLNNQHIFTSQQAIMPISHLSVWQVRKQLALLEKRKRKRNEKRRDRKRKRNSTMPQTFTLFPKLPPELRRIIWEFCLPSRVFEVHDLYKYDHCQLEATSRINTRPPIITRVCVESRLVRSNHPGFWVIESRDSEASRHLRLLNYF